MAMEALCLQYVPEAASKLSQRHGSSKVRGRWLLSVGPTNSRGKGLVSCGKAAIASSSSQYPLTKLENSEGILSVGQRGEFGTALRTCYVSVREGHIQCSTASSESSLSSDSPSSSSSSSSTAKSSSSTELPLPSSTPTGRRRPPVFVLNEKPDRNLQQLENLSSRQRPKRNLEDSLGDDDGSIPTTTNANHRSGYVALIGRPNVGKSTLMNQIIGQKLSIVTNKPQTTRHRILGICSTPDYQMILYDTPGMIVKRLNKLDEMMMQNVRTAALNADCVLVIVDATETPKMVIESLEEGALKIVQSRPSLLVMNKKDKIKPGEIAKKVQWYEQHSGLNEVLPVSAKYGQGISELKGWLVSKLPLGPAYYPKENISDQPEKFFASEIIREKIFLQYMKEIPYVSQVNVTSYVERTPPAKDYIVVEIIVERETQKAIVIGKEGSALKTLATAARLDIEDFIGREVFLEIKVKVKEDWRANENLLKYYGYSGQIA